LEFRPARTREARAPNMRARVDSRIVVFMIAPKARRQSGGDRRDSPRSRTEAWFERGIERKRRASRGGATEDRRETLGESWVRLPGAGAGDRRGVSRGAGASRGERSDPPTAERGRSGSPHRYFKNRKKTSIRRPRSGAKPASADTFYTKRAADSSPASIERVRSMPGGEIEARQSAAPRAD
jgi:hypothetical protein